MARAFLVLNGANVNSRDCNKQTSIHNVVISGSLSTVEELLSSGADPLAKDKEEINPLHYAVKYDRKTIVVCLLILPEAQCLVTDIDFHGESPVHCALKMGLSDIIADSKLWTRMETTISTWLHQLATAQPLLICSMTPAARIN